jgi:protease-4
MGDVAASGGYYIASAADRIYADPATLTGSIGVIMETTELYELFNKIGVDMVTIKSGKHKDIGSPARPMTPEERQILQSVINDVFDQFVTDVSKGRKLPKAKVLKLADGRIYTGRQAVNLGLVDRTGSLEDALRAAARDAGIKGEFSIVEYERPPSLLDLMVGPTDTSVPEWLRHRALLGEFARSLLRVGSDIHVN